MSDITTVKIATREPPRRYRGYYPGIEDDMATENNQTVPNISYDVELHLKAEKRIVIYCGYEEKDATHLVSLISHFLQSGTERRERYSERLETLARRFRHGRGL